MKLQSFKFVFLFILTLYSCSSDDSSDTGSNLDPTLEFEQLNVSYGTDSDQVYDIYLPANRNMTTKTIILVHGGGWTSGDKSSMLPFVQLIKQELPNYSIVNINYRLADQDNQPYPMQINDITTIIEQIKSEQDYYVMSDNFGFIGTSAGAHLSLLWSYAFDTENNIDMVTSIVGPTNFTDPAYLNNTNPALQTLIDQFGINPTTAYLEEVSPYHQVTTSAPPTQLFNGGQDPLIPTTQGTDLRDRLAELGVTHEFTLYANAGHGWTNGVELLDTWTKIKAFVNVHL